MNDPRFIKSELKVTASEELDQEVQEELQNLDQVEEMSIASVLSQQSGCCGGKCEEEKKEV
jgi:hypothetical protein|tara:strand:- start:11628 stop:11810 length:183 start_codon:yes stop_codon:yes gene_type:complete